MKPEQVICEIKELCASVTECTYNDILWQGYGRLTVLYAMGQNQEQVYQSLVDYYNQLKDGIIQDCVADLLDFAVGWCSPQWYIWKNDNK